MSGERVLALPRPRLNSYIAGLRPTLENQLSPLQLLCTAYIDIQGPVHRAGAFSLLVSAFFWHTILRFLPF